MKNKKKVKFRLKKGVMPSGTFSCPTVVESMLIEYNRDDCVCVQVKGVYIDHNSATGEHYIFVGNPIFADSNKKRLGQNWQTLSQKISSPKKRHLKKGVSALLARLEARGYTYSIPTGGK